ncbi:hypothetical protein Cal7507_4280 [Calothrix sp. PCC 7507]|nr:hypothetical protein Cal7507_4280 [Calothrix sp. PCC 7507]
MLILKRQKLTLSILMLIGIAYFSAMSDLEINYFLKCVIAIIPIQVGAIFYMTHLRRNRP